VARVMRMPEVAAGGTEAVLHDWSVAESASFSAEDVLATVETDKAVVDVEAEHPGVVVRLLVAAGTTVEVGAPIAVLAEPGETVDDVDALLAALGVADGAAAPPDPEGAPDQPASPPVPEPLAVAAVGASGLNPSAADAGSSNGHGRVFASPLARRLARDAGLALGSIAGSGPGGRIVRRDVEAAAAAGPAPAAAPGPSPSSPPPVAPAPVTAAAPAHAAGTGFTDVPHTPMRRAIARRLTESKQTIPHFTVRATLRVDRLLALRAELNALPGEGKVTVTDLLVKAAAVAHTRVPAVNAIWTPDATRRFDTVDVAVAVATGTGLLTPVLRGVEVLPIAAVAAGTRELAERARAGRLRQDDLEGGALTITNLGMYGTEEFAAIINPPQSAILAVGAARREPVVDDDRLVAATVLRVTLSADHRVIDGALAAEWMAAFTALVEQPLAIVV
jgi:pyruvate dehydrogenase E2 component (dihydrolipoamide acetyltransferase)